MSRGHWCIVITAGGCLAASQAEGQQQSQRSDNRAQAAEAQAKAQTNQAALSSLANSADAIVRQVTPSEQDERDAATERDRSRQDLIAQQDSARWAWIIMIFTGAQLILSAVGIYFIVQTLRQGGVSLRTAFSGLKQAGRAARAAEASIKVAERSAAAAETQVGEMSRIGEAQVRCYLTGTEAKIGYIDNGSVIATCTVKNSGQSPARNVRCVGKLSHFIPDGSPTRFAPPPKSTNIPEFHIPAGGEQEFIVGTYDFSFSDTEKAYVGPNTLLISTLEVEITGVDVFGCRVEETDKFNFYCRAIPAPNGWNDMIRSATLRSAASESCEES